MAMLGRACRKQSRRLSRRPRFVDCVHGASSTRQDSVQQPAIEQQHATTTRCDQVAFGGGWPAQALVQHQCGSSGTAARRRLGKVNHRAHCRIRDPIARRGRCGSMLIAVVMEPVASPLLRTFVMHPPFGAVRLSNFGKPLHDKGLQMQDELLHEIRRRGLQVEEIREEVDFGIQVLCPEGRGGSLEGNAQAPEHFGRDGIIHGENALLGLLLSHLLVLLLGRQLRSSRVTIGQGHVAEPCTIAEPSEYRVSISGLPLLAQQQCQPQACICGHTRQRWRDAGLGICLCDRPNERPLLVARPAQSAKALRLLQQHPRPLRRTRTSVPHAAEDATRSGATHG
mmetsp:Transcript_24950/g.83252  ORF Transcript_24950/g.83252 Transcript_24950/m.83252 type:complete len:340 (+) Transcript_24950:478-1497(+)